MSRRAAKVDENQAEIVKGLRRIGCTVQPLHTVGEGCPDLLVGWQGFNFLFEVKDGNKMPSEQKLTPAQIKWHESWRGQRAVVKDLDQAIQYLNSRNFL